MRFSEGQTVNVEGKIRIPLVQSSNGRGGFSYFTEDCSHSAIQLLRIAGHWDLDDGTPEAAVAREIAEEAGIEIRPDKSVFVETLEEPCRRGADFQEWRL